MSHLWSTTRLMTMGRSAMVAAGVAVAVLAGGCGGAPPWGAVEDAAGERQRVQCRGAAAPAVVLVHGIGDRASSASYEDVIERLPADRRVCRYDRPGAGDSPAPRRAGRTAADLDAELDAVVRAADPARPVVLVGHSFGSYPVLAYTAGHRERVAGAVLVDGVEPGLGLAAALGADSLDAVPQAREGLDLPAVQRGTAELVTGGREEFADLPLTVLRRGRGTTPAWLTSQERLAALSRQGTLAVAEEVGHDIPTDDPEAVAAAITALPRG
jgi:pimeloyl-ACP methyl ester carboxylesterase